MRAKIARNLTALIAGVLAFALFASAFAAQLGQSVHNVATVSYSSGGGSVVLSTPPATFVIHALPTPSTINFMRIAPSAPDAVPTALNGSDYAVSAAPYVFQPISVLTRTNGAPVDLGAPVRLVPAQAFYAGEPIVVRVTDLGQNGDPASIETVVVQIVSGTGDAITLRLYESGPDTGVFYGYFQSAGGAFVLHDGVLSIAQGLQIVATYVDPFDASEISVDTAGVDPYGRIFDSATGTMLDDVTVTIVDDATGLPAPVFGVDGVSAYPSTLVTGSTVTDAGGTVYALSPGEFRFPIMFPGRYRLIVAPPPGYSAPSAASAPSIAALPGAPFVIAPASYLAAFDLDGTGDVNFDVPLDPGSDVLLTKTASAESGAVGDFIRYEIAVRNLATSGSSVAVRDILPRGFRFKRGSARIDGAVAIDPEISPDGSTLLFASAPVAPGAAMRISYVAEITSGARAGEAVNSAAAVNAVGLPVSNIAEAAVLVRDDFLRNRLNIVGRVSEGACAAGVKPPLKLAEGTGVPGVRLYLETGAWTATDEDGLFHFEDVKPGAHVVQLDVASLPEGYEAVRCVANTRFAGSAISQFVDAQGGAVWRADFYLRRKEGAAPAAAKRPEDVATETDAAALFDKDWLNGQSPEPAFVYPAPGMTPSARAVNLGVKHPNGYSVTLTLNGRDVPTANFAGRDVNQSRAAALTRWRGVDIAEGENIFVATIFDRSKAEVARLEHRLHFVTIAARAVYAPDQSRLVADGKTSPVIAVRVTDGAGRPVHPGRLIEVVIDPPYRAKNTARLEESLPISTPLAARTQVSVGPDGVARIELEPTLETGIARLRVLLDGGARQDVAAYLKPKLRDWIVVGLAEGTLQSVKTSEAGAAPAGRDLLKDGRVAVFAKGAVKGGWLVTAAGDTAKKRGERDDVLFDAVDPDDRYALYGDRSKQQFEAQSRYPVYLKAEKDAFQALIGDYDTGLTQSKLGRYARRMTGARIVYEGERTSLTAFASETNQQFLRDEIAADGTSGPFRLSAAPLVRNSETLVVETRDRFRPDIVLATQPLVRYLDYDIDFRTGELLFRLPVPAAKDPASYNVIVAEYETSAAVERAVTAGGRVARRFLDGRAEAGASFIHEEGAGAGAPIVDLAAIDLALDLTDTTGLRLEYGSSWRNEAGSATRRDAALAEIEHASRNVTGRAYYADTQEGFGLAQQISAIVGVRRYGADISWRFQEFDPEKSGQRGGRFIDAKAYREENLVTGASRAVAELALRQESPVTSASAGLRAVDERPVSAPRRRSLLSTTSFRHVFEKMGLTVRASQDQPLLRDGDSTLFPKRTIIGFDQRILDKVTLNFTHEAQDGENASSSNTIVGVTAEPWAGARLTAAADKITQDSGERVGATLGVDQQVRLSKAWSTSFGVARRQELASDGVIDAPDDIVPDGVVSPLEEDREFTSVYAGLAYRSANTTGSARVEMKKSELGKRFAGIVGAAREASQTLSFAGAARYQHEENDAAPDRKILDARLGAALRPRGDGMIIFDRFDVGIDHADGAQTSWKAVNNLAINAKLDPRWEVSLNHGVKYAELNDGIDVYSGFTQLVGIETRFDLTSKVDIGMRGMALYSHSARTLDYSYGPSIGLSPADNIWLSFGWNFAGFRDDDFIAAEYAQSGPYVTLRIKFDQTTAKGLLDSISPERAK